MRIMIKIFDISGSSYFAALCKVGIEKVVDNVDTRDLMEFLETHIAAAAFTKNNQVLEEIIEHACQSRTFVYRSYESCASIYREAAASHASWSILT